MVNPRFRLPQEGGLARIGPSVTPGRKDHGNGYRHARARARLLRGSPRLCLGLQRALKEPLMFVDYLLGGAVTALLLVYLTYALLRPERF